MSEQLTANTCARLNNPTNYTVLVSNPVLKVVEITDANMKLWDFVVTWVATVTDGESTAQVVLPSSLCIWASGTGPHRMVSQDDVIKVQRMLRLPHEDTRYGRVRLTIHCTCFLIVHPLVASYWSTTSRSTWTRTSRWK